MQRRFFVTIFAPDQKAFVALRRLDLDLFSLPSNKRGEASIGGLLTEADIERVRGAGYRVQIVEEYVEQGRKQAKKSAGKMAARDAAEAAGQGGTPVPPVQTMNDKAWLKEFNRRKKVQ